MSQSQVVLILSVKTVSPYFRILTYLLMLIYGIVGENVQIYRSYRYSDKTDMDKTDQTKRTTFQDKTDYVSGQNGRRSRTKRTRPQDKTDHVSGQNGPYFRTNRTM